MSIKLRIVGSVAVVFFMAVVMFAVTWIGTAAQKDDGLVINLAGRQRMLSQKLAKEALQAVLTGKGAETGGLKKTARVFSRTLEALSDSGKAPLTLDPSGPSAELPRPEPEIKAQLSKVESLWNGYERAVFDAAAGDKKAVERIVPLSVQVLKEMNAAVVMMQKAAEGKVAGLLLTQGVLLAIALAVLVFVLVNTGRDLILPLERIRQFAGDVAGGNFDAELEGRYKNELLELKESLESMLSGIKESMQLSRSKEQEAEAAAGEARASLEEARVQEEKVGKLMESMSSAADKAGGISDSLATSVEALMGRVEEVNRGVDIQRNRMEETATAMEEMNSTVMEVARSASDAAESADRSRENARTGAEGVRDAVDSIQRIQERILSLKETMGSLGDEADSIGQIMNVISDIADQTNLLALNAAIEAARAGDAGRGFAVVADEVRKLAEKTMTATKEVGEAVEKIQSNARRNIEAVDAAAEDITASTEAAAESGRFMEAIVDIVSETAGQVESIATASEEQSAASEEINRAVSEVTRVAEETADGMDASAASLNELSALADELDSVIRVMSGDTSGRAREKKRPSAPPAQTPKPDREPPKPAAPEPSAPKNGNGVMVQWSDDLSVNVESIDDEHKVLVNMINELHQAMKNRQAKDVLIHIVDDLKQYAVKHFKHEEDLFDEFGYPGALNHKAIHKKFVDAVLEFDRNLRAGKAAVTMEVMRFLKDWLVGHIQGVDKKYGPFFNDKGVY